MHLAGFLWNSLHRAAQAEIFTILCIGAVAVTFAADVALAADAAVTAAAAGVSSNCGNRNPTAELPKPLLASRKLHDEAEADLLPAPSTAPNATQSRQQRAHTQRPTLMDIALQVSAREGLDAMTELYGKIVPDIIRNGQLLEENHPATLLSQFSAPVGGSVEQEMAAYATISATKAFRKNYKHFNELARQAHTPRISLRRTALEGLCPPRDPPTCIPASERYRTHDGTCNNKRRPRWGAAQMPFNRFLPPEYGDGVDSIRDSVEGGPLSSSRFVSLLVHGAKDGEAALTLMTAQWGQLLDHDMTSTAQPRSINGSVPSCCGSKDFHPSCFPIKVPLDDPWLAPLKVRCLEFLRSAPAQRRDCILSWREQTNQATSYIDASPIYANSAKSSDNARVFRNGLLVFGRGNPAEDVCQRGAIATQCIRAGDGRSGEQPGLLALHHVWVGEHNRIAMELSEMNLHWSDEKIYQETRRIIGAMFQHITYREFLPIVLGREVCKLFDLDLLSSGYYDGYDAKVNPAVANSFAAAAFRFGHSLVQNSYIRCDRHHNVIRNNVSLHEEFQRGDIGSAGSLHRLIRGMATQRALKRDEFITPELTNHLFQTPGFPFGLDLAAINIQRGRDHGIPPYTSWRVPCGLTPITTWEDFVNVVGPESAQRIGHAYRSVHDIDLFVGGIAERPVVGGLVGPTFACILAQQFSNSRKGDRFWYENGGFESAFTPAQLHSIRRVSLAQVLCRAVGGGTFQPHIFIPAEFPDNERLPCGAGPLAPIDLSPWQEQDPFTVPTAPPAPTFSPDRVFEIISTDPQSSSHFVKENKAGFSNRVRPTTSNATSTPLAHVPHIDSSGFQRPADVVKIHDKLDIRQKFSPAKRPTTARPIKGIHNKLDKGTKVTLNIKNMNLHRTHTTRRATVVVNNIPIELRSAAPEVGETKQSVKNGLSNAKGLKVAGAEAKPSNRHSNTLMDVHTDKAEARADDDDDDSTQVGDNLEHIRGEADTMTVQNSSTPCNVEDNETVTTVAEEDIFDIFSTLTEPTTTETTTELIQTDDDHDNTSHLAGITSTRVNLTDMTANHTTENQPRANLTDMTDTQPRANLTDTIEDQPNSGNEFSSDECSGGTNVVRKREKENVSVKRPNNNSSISKQPDNLLDINANSTDTSSESEQAAKILTDISDIDPFTHTSTHAHKRVHRRKLYDRTNRTAKRNNDTTKTTTKPQTRTKTLTTKTPKATKPPQLKRTTQLANPTQRNVELRQYQTQQTFYTRPQKVVVSGPNADQYEIEINIRQTNKKNPSSTRPHVSTYTGGDYTYKPYGFDRYSPDYASDYYASTVPQQPYYQSPPTMSSPIPQLHRTKPPTVIYLSEHDERTTTRQPGLLHNFISFATSGLAGGNRPHPSPHSSVQKEKPISESGVTSIHISSPHSSNSGAPSAHYAPRPPSLPSSQSILPVSSSAVSLSQVGGLVGVGAVHATSSAVSAGSFGSITGVASANGADSTFSFNIRPKPNGVSQTGLLPPNPSEVGSYGLVPPRKPIYAPITKPEYVSLPVATSMGGHAPSYYETPHKESVNSPFSTSQKRPQSHTYEYYSRTQNSPQLKKSNSNDRVITVHDYDEYINSRTLQPIMTNDTSAEEEDDDAVKTDDYDYDDEHTDVGKKFDRDGYLRPEHMANALFKIKQPNNPSRNDTCQHSNASFLDDNYVLPMLNITLSAQTDLPEPIAATTDVPHLTENVTDFPDVVGKHFSNDILAEDYDDETTEPLIASKTDALRAMTARRKDAEPVKPATGIAFAPIKVLTKLERPDNWVIYDMPNEKPLLPELPQIAFDSSSSTAEIPMPIQGLLDIRIKKPNNKEREQEAATVFAVQENDKLTTTDSVTLTETETEITDVDRTTTASNDLTATD